MVFENEKVSWDDLRIFLAVARSGGLSAAAGESGLSAPSLNRRINALEQALAVKLFERRARGYVLTRDGQDLADRAAPMEMQARAVEAWRAQRDRRSCVRIACGFWTGTFIARGLGPLLDRHGEEIRIEILSGAHFLNLSRREADLAIRNRAPTQQGLARRRIGPVEFAIYGGVKYVERVPAAHRPARLQECDWVVPGASAATGASTRWLQHRLERPAAVTCDTPSAVVEAAAAGAGLCVLPRIAGDGDGRLVRCSGSIDALRHTQWLVSHDDTRREKPIRTVSGALFTLFSRHQSQFAPENAA